MLWRMGAVPRLAAQGRASTRTYRPLWTETCRRPVLYSRVSVGLGSYQRWRSDAPKKPPPPSTPAPPAVALSEDILTLPNILTLSRMGLCPVIGWAVATHQAPLALGLLAVAGSTDLLDGWIARRYQSRTVLGSIADPAADKMLMATMVVSLGVSGAMPWPLALLILGRDVFLVGLAFYMRYRSLPPPRTLSRYFNPRLPSVHVTPTRISKANTFLQLVLVGILTLLPLLPEEWRTHPHTQRAVTVLEGIVAATTLWTGLDYAVSRRSVRYLHVP